MITKTELKYYSTLLQKKYREEEDKFLVEGHKLITVAVNAGYQCEVIFFTKEFEKLHSEIFSQFNKKRIRVEEISNASLRKITDAITPQEIVGVFRRKDNNRVDEKANIIVALENINDPGNLGAIIRNCDWFGFNSIILDDNCAELFNPKVIRSSAGSIFNLRVVEEKNFQTILSNLKAEGYIIICADLNGENVYQQQWNDKFVIAFANEANGPSGELLRISDSIITIPGRGRAESMNVANAAAVVLSEISKTVR